MMHGQKTSNYFIGVNQHLNMFANFYVIVQYHILNGTFPIACEMRDTANLTFSVYCKLCSGRGQENIFIATVHIYCYPDSLMFVETH
jgi:hypothetical protein